MHCAQRFDGHVAIAEGGKQVMIRVVGQDRIGIALVALPADLTSLVQRATTQLFGGS